MKSKYPIAFYQNLGKLFYAISACDKSVNEKETTALMNLIKAEWEEDLYLKHIEITFKNLVLEHAKSDACFKEFIEYMNANKSLFSNRMNRLISHTAGFIASSFSKRNKSELVMLAQLELELRKLHFKK